MEFLKGIGKGVSLFFSKLFSWDFLFGVGLSLGTKLLRFYGLIAFTWTIIESLTIAIQSQSVPVFFIELIKRIVTVDQNIYQLSTDFNSINNPTLFNAVTTLLLILKNMFFYKWWHWVFKKMILDFGWVFPFSLMSKMVGMQEHEKTEDILKTKLNWYAFKVLYVFLIVTNLVNMIFITKTITFNFIPIVDYKTVLTNAWVFFNTFFTNWWHFFVAFKGIGHYLLSGSLFKTIALFTGAKLNLDFKINLTQNLSRNISGG